MKQYLDQARAILDTKNSGPCGVLAYAWANATRQKVVQKNGQSFAYNEPYIDPKSGKKLEPYYTVIRTNRKGVELVVPAGGGQDIEFCLNGKTLYVELKKSLVQKAFLKDVMGVDCDQVNDQTFVAMLLSNSAISRIQMESPFSAAVRETAEEHGWDYRCYKHQSLVRVELDEALFLARSYNTTPPTPVSQKLFVVETNNFEGVEPVYTHKVENKAQQRLGNQFYEQGDFMSLKQIKTHLDKVRDYFNQASTTIDPIHYQTTKSRFEMIKRVHNEIVLPSLEP